MEVGLTHLIDKRSAAHVEESRTFNAAVLVAAGDQPQPNPATPEGLQTARSQVSSRPPSPRALERIAHAGGRQVPVRIITPKEGQARAAYLQIHGGGFFMDSAARSDTRNAVLADAVGVAVVSDRDQVGIESWIAGRADECGIPGM